MPDEPRWYNWYDQNSYFRIVPRGADPLWFNPNTSTDPADPSVGGRFHPFDSADGHRVPTFYAASSLKAALAESPLLHDFPLVPAAYPLVLSMAKVAQYQYSVVRARRELRLIDLTRLGSDRVRIANELVSWCRREDYPVSRLGAQLLHTKYISAQGIHWTSRRYPPADCVLLFGDRMADSAEELAAETPALRDFHESGTTGFASLQAVMLEAGIIPSP
jgi:RES domain-containing protein